MRSFICATFLLHLATNANGQMGASHLDYGNGGAIGGVLGGIVETAVLLFVVYLIAKDNKRVLIWIGVYLICIIGLFASGHQTTAAVILVLTLPSLLLFGHFKDEYKNRKEEHGDRVEEQRSSEKVRRHNHPANVEVRNSTVGQLPSVKPDRNESSKTDAGAAIQAKNGKTSKQPYSGGLVYQIGGRPHQFNGSGFDEIDTDQSAFINGKSLSWNGTHFVEKN